MFIYRIHSILTFNFKNSLFSLTEYEYELEIAICVTEQMKTIEKY